LSTCKKKPYAFKIGTLNESSLHRTLKFSYAGHGGKTEARAGEYVADGIKKDGEYIEVQTGSFAPLQKKVKKIAKLGKVRIIHPIALTKKIEVYDTDGKLLYRRKSPIKGSKWNLFNALIHVPQLPLTRSVTIEIVMVDITDKRIKDGKGSWRRKGISLHDRELASWHESIHLKKTTDYLQFIPFKKGEKFTSSILSEMTGIDKSTARKALYVLTKMKVVKRKGRKGSSWVYLRAK
jgi:hypothetical protein